MTEARQRFQRFQRKSAAGSALSHWRRLRQQFSRARGTWPNGVWSTDYLQPPLSPALRVHLRALIGWDTPARALALIPIHVWQLGRWLMVSPETVARRQIAHHQPAGVPVGAAAPTVVVGQPAPDWQFLRRHSVTLADVSRYSLATTAQHADFKPSSPVENSWSEYIFDYERNWNLAASLALVTPNANWALAGESMLFSRWCQYREQLALVRTNISALSDKSLTNERLQRVGVPTVPTSHLAAATTVDLAELVAELLSRWPSTAALFFKPRVGSRGEDCYVAAIESVPTPVQDGTRVILRRYQCVESSMTAAQVHRELMRNLADRDYLVQPLLTSDVGWVELADPRDVVTIRIVTRTLGSTTAVFSRAIEIPLPADTFGARYLLAGVAANGQITRLALPNRTLQSLPQPILQIWQKLASKIVPNQAQLDQWALRAHGQFPGLFAVAWDIALSDQGAVFLEGNAGFGTIAPQLIAGGLLSELPLALHPASSLPTSTLPAR